MILFGSDLIFGSIFKFQEPSIMLVAGFINFDVTNQTLQVSLNFVVEDLILVLYYEFADIRFCELLVIYETNQIMELNYSLSIVLVLLYLSI